MIRMSAVTGVIAFQIGISNMSVRRNSLIKGEITGHTQVTM